MSFDFTAAERRTMWAAAKSLHRSYGIDPDDLYQEFAVWMSRRPEKVREFRTKPGLYTTLARLGAKHCKKALRAANGGAHLNDHQKYGKAELRELLTQALELDLGQLSSMEFDDMPGTGGDPALGGDHLVAIVDVRKALYDISSNQSQALLHAAWIGFDYDLLGEEITSDAGEPIGPEAARRRCDYYLTNLQKALNGEPVGGRPARDVKTDDDAREFYSRQLRGLEECTGQRWIKTNDALDPYESEDYYGRHGAAWDSYGG